MQKVSRHGYFTRTTVLYLQSSETKDAKDILKGKLRGLPYIKLLKNKINAKDTNKTNKQMKHPSTSQ